MKLIALGLVFAGILALLGAQALRAAPEADDFARARSHVEKTCTGCHAGAQLDVVVNRRLDPENPGSLDAFLTNHHVADPALRAEVMAYLKARVDSASREP